MEIKNISHMEEIKRLSRNGLSFLTNEEGGIILHPYLDSAGIPTISAGCTYYANGKRVTMQDPDITLTQAIKLFMGVITHYEKTVWSLTRDDINQNMFDSLVSLTFNIGVEGFKTSTVLKRVNLNPNDPLIKPAFLMWNKITDQNTGKLIVSKGLKARRQREADLYFS